MSKNFASFSQNSIDVSHFKILADLAYRWQMPNYFHFADTTGDALSVRSLNLAQPLPRWVKPNLGTSKALAHQQHIVGNRRARLRWLCQGKGSTYLVEAAAMPRKSTRVGHP